MISESTIKEASRLLSDAAPGATIILFGSYARGDAREKSDLDIMVVEPVVTARREEMVRLGDVLDELDLDADIIVVSKKNFEAWRDTPGTVIYQAALEGKVLHE